MWGNERSIPPDHYDTSNCKNERVHSPTAVLCQKIRILRAGVGLVAGCASEVPRFETEISWCVGVYRCPVDSDVMRRGTGRSP